MTLEGQRLDRYHIVRLIGSGGMGDVYLAQDPHIGQQVAIKVIRMGAGSDLEALNDTTRLFQREARAVVALDHPHILSLYDYGEQLIGDDKIVYLVMPYRPEGSLTQWLRKRSQQGPLASQDVASMIRQAAEALQHAHEHQIIHQDVKPSNFLLRERKETPTRPDLLLADFSIARLSGATSNVSQAVRGTPTYMAPEQWQGKPVFATDQYALAIMAYELLVGHPPFQGSPHQMMYQHLMEQPVPPSRANSHLPEQIDAVLLRALAKQPEARFPSITAFAEALQQAIQAPTGDLQAGLAISPEEAERGTTRTITLPTGRTLTVTIPPKVQDGHIIFLAGEGEREPENGQRGNVLLTVMVKRESKPLADEKMMEPTGHAMTVEQENRPPVISPTVPAVPAGRSDSGGMQPVSLSTVGETLTPTRFASGGPGGPVHPPDNPITPIPPPPPDYRPPEEKSSPAAGRQRLLRVGLGVATVLLLVLSAIVGVGASQDYAAVNALKMAPTQTASAQQRATQITNHAASATARAESYPSYLPGHGTPALFDALSKPGFWDNSDDGNGGTCKFTEGAYHVRETQPNTFNSYCVGSLSFTNYAFEVEMTIIQGDCGDVLFRDDSENSKFYRFEICQEGKFLLDKFVDTQGKHATTLVQNQVNSAITPGAFQTNLVAVVVQGNQITLFVNKRQVAMMQDKSYTEGSIALVASAINDPTEVVFRNIKIWTL